MFDPHFPHRAVFCGTALHRTPPHAHDGTTCAATPARASQAPDGCTRGAARRLYLQEAKRCHPDAGVRRARSIALHSAWREFSLAPRRRMYTRRSSPSSPARLHLRLHYRRSVRCRACCGGDTGFWSAPRIEAVRQATWRRARADCWIGAWRQPQPRGPLDRPPPLVLVVSRRRRPPPPPRCPALCPTSTSAARASSTRRCCGSRWSPTILSRALSSPRRSIAHVTRSSSRCGARSRRTAAAASGCAAA